MVNVRLGAIARATILVFATVQLIGANQDDKKPGAHGDLCSDEKTCSEMAKNYKNFTTILVTKAKETHKMYTSVLKKMTRALNDSQIGRDFIGKYKLPRDEAVETLIARHRSHLSTECEPQSCKCPLLTYICHERDPCPRIKVNRERCSEQPKCHEICKMTKISANGTSHKRMNKSERTFRGNLAELTPHSVANELIDALGLEVNFLAGPFALVAHRVSELEPRCDGQPQGGECLESGAASRRSFWCTLTGCEDDDVKLKRLEKEMRKKNDLMREDLDKREDEMNHKLYRKLDPKSVLMMREAFPILTRTIDNFAKSLQCTCKVDVCEANKKLWKCSQFCPNNLGCDTHRCDCPYH